MPNEPAPNPLVRVVRAAQRFRLAEQYGRYPRSPPDPKFRHELWEALDALAIAGAAAELNRLAALPETDDAE